MMWGWNGMAAGGWIFMTLFWIALIALIVWAVAALFPRGQERERRPQETPQEILDRRFARGEIDADTYQSMRDQLNAPATTAR